MLEAHILGVSVTSTLKHLMLFAMSPKVTRRIRSIEKQKLQEYKCIVGNFFFLSNMLTLFMSSFIMIVTYFCSLFRHIFTSNFLVGGMSKHSLRYFWCSPSKAWCKPMIKLKKAPRFNGIYSCTYTVTKSWLGYFC